MSDSAKWYVIHTYSGYENAVKSSIEKFVTGRGMEEKILRLEIPLETVTEVSGGSDGDLIWKSMRQKPFCDSTRTKPQHPPLRLFGYSYR